MGTILIGTDSLSKLTYVANVNSNDVTVIDTKTNTAAVPVRRLPREVGAIGQGSQCYHRNVGGRIYSHWHCGELYDEPGILGELQHQ